MPLPPDDGPPGFIEGALVPVEGLIPPVGDVLAGWAEQWAARPRLRGWQHAAAIVPAAAVGIGLTVRARSRRERVAAASWGAGLVGMLASSAAYHRLPRTERAAQRLRRLDHAAIWGAVAGTWTPVALAVLPGPAGTALASTMWGTAVVAAGAKTAAFDRVDPRVNVLYVAMGWAGVLILPKMWRRLGPGATAMLMAGGAAYTLGAIGYAAKWPNLVPGVYGYHEMWHTATLAGAGFHAVSVVAALDAIRAAAARA